MEALVGNTLQRIIADAGYRGHNAPKPLRVASFRQRRITFVNVEKSRLSLHRRSSRKSPPQ
ncbi:MAG: hypothetical protein KGL97_14850 [Alphaproteobacteria bacterium]|nr:hypothetical protein [Alphaproteobacteria bacterium]